MSWLIEQIKTFSSRPAIVDGQGCYSYADLVNQIVSYKTQLDAQFEDGQVVAILSDYNFNAVALFFALYQKKAIIVPIVFSSHDELEKRMKVVMPGVVIKLNKTDLVFDKKTAIKDRHPMIKGLQDAKQPGLVLFSSGSTGEPKAMIHNLAVLVNSYQGKKTKNLNILVFLMFDHIGGLNTLLNSLAMGAKIVLPSSRNPDVIASLIATHQIHVLPASPTFLNLMLIARVQERFNLSSLKMITYGTESMPASLLKKIKTRFPRIKLLQTFGTSETGIAQTASRSSESLELKLDDPNIKYQVVDGELWLKSNTQIIGYLNASMESFTEDGWFKTGDLVEELEDGYICIKGRAKEVINVGGEKVLPAEVESIVLELDFINDCMAYSEKHAITGQIVALQVVLKSDILPNQAKKLIRKHCHSRLAGYKVPVKIDFVATTSFSERFKKRRLQS
ncbi:ANL family adenylate-forming protein [Thiosulfativibrio zosterae]|uniref:AMP-dependent synthetase n=1 Tax=Thiosulfativibrio zosterae TaxID=2675053 RepID=A0A6F8PLV1_9GAMM|nr:fatty acid--CoA ligase family protein [Thiosulfativibrio zosterae]BBP43091.1 AMP-dependent synthetase [Thiosulfativibrio zosterae]